MKISNVFRARISALAEEFTPQYINEIPFLRGRSTSFYSDDKMMIFAAEYGLQMSMALFHSLNDQSLIDSAQEIISQTSYPSYSFLRDKLGENYFSFNKFTIVASISNGMISSAHFESVLVDWLNGNVLPQILENNRQRVLDAIPTPPQYDMDTISKNIFILEDESDNMNDLGKQGTCFYLKGTGFITCNHVLTPAMQCFCHQAPDKKYSVRVIKSNKDIDLAILDIPDLLAEHQISGLETGCSDILECMDHIAVAGFPNYHLGDTGILSPGLIIGFRPVHGIRRLLINAPIVSGNSGGPVFDGNNNVIGVAVTGADCSENVQKTENHGVIPIEALSYLQY